MLLTSKQKSYLKGQAHSLSAYVTLGKNGLTGAVLKEMDKTLEDHELIKVRVIEEDREIFQSTIKTLESETGSNLVGSLGRIAIFFRLNPNVNRFKLST